MTRRIMGRVFEQETGCPVGGLLVRAYHRDQPMDSLLGTAISDGDGRFEIRYPDEDLQGSGQQGEAGPEADLFLTLHDARPASAHQGSGVSRDAPLPRPSSGKAGGSEGPGHSPPLSVTGLFRFRQRGVERPLRCGVSADGQLDLAIPREVFGTLAPEPSEMVEGGLDLSDDALRFEQRDGHDLPRLNGFHECGLAGKPTLLERIDWILLPPGARTVGLTALPGEAVPSAPGLNPQSRRAPRLQPNVGGTGGLGPWRGGDAASGAVASADPGPTELAVLAAEKHLHGLPMVGVRLRPLSWDADAGRYLFYPRLRYVLRFDPSGLRNRLGEWMMRDMRLSRREAERTASVFRDPRTRVAPVLQDHCQAILRKVLLSATPPQGAIPYVIVTDDFLWTNTAVDRGDGTTRSPNLSERGSAVPGTTEGDTVVEQFLRLAQWKAQRGTLTRVVTLSELLDPEQAWGDLTEGGFARDLQEVIRNFVKFAFRKWGTEFLLLGGDEALVPMRRFVGICPRPAPPPDGAWDCTRVLNRDYNGDGDCPPARGCKVLKEEERAIAKLHLDLGLLGNSMPAATTPLFTQHGGRRIPFFTDAAPDGPLWFFPDQKEFEKNTSGFTRLQTVQIDPATGGVVPYAIVEGPAAVVDDDYYYVTDDREIPCDLYYGAVEHPAFSRPGIHDFDPQGTGVYGQFHFNAAANCEEPLRLSDGTPSYDPLSSQVLVGRAPVESGEQARAFVDKVMCYERLEAIDGRPVDLGYLLRRFYVADYWMHEDQYSCKPGDGDPPARGHYAHRPGTGVARLHLVDKLTEESSGERITLAWPEHLPTQEYGYPYYPKPNYRLVAIFGHQREEIPYRNPYVGIPQGQDPPRWRFTEATYQSDLHAVSEFVRVDGADFHLDPDRFFWEPVYTERGAVEKEILREQMDKAFPEFVAVSRFYRDYFELPTPPALMPLRPDLLTEALHGGCHFLSLSGHGGTRGCCEVYTDGPGLTSLSNQARGFIAFGESCSTARPDDAADSLGETLVKQPAGALAYVGNVRMGLGRVGADHERAFWRELASTERLGSAAALRRGANEADLHLWQALVQILYGDPETPVWTAMPRRYWVSPDRTDRGDGKVAIAVRVRDLYGKPLSGHLVTVVADWQNEGPFLFKQAETDASGQAEIVADNPGGEISLTVTHPGFKPFVENV